MCNLTLLLWACCQQVHQHLAHFSLPPLTLLFFNSGPICYLAKTFGIFQCHVEIYQRISFHRNPWHARANLHSLWRGSPQSRGIVSRYNPFLHFKSNEHFDGSLLHHSFQFPLCFKTTLFSRCFLITITPLQLVVYSSAFEHCFYGKGKLNAILYYYYYYWIWAFQSIHLIWSLVTRLTFAQLRRARLLTNSAHTQSCTYLMWIMAKMSYFARHVVHMVFCSALVARVPDWSIQ